MYPLVSPDISCFKKYCRDVLHVEEKKTVKIDESKETSTNKVWKKKRSIKISQGW